MGEASITAATDIVEALISISDNCIWATELAFLGGARRIDFFTLQPTASQQFRTSAYEIKVSRADFRRDSREKQDHALRWSDRFWYVTPTGLIAPSEAPEWAGLMEWDGKAFRVKRKAPRRSKAPPDWEFIVSMLRFSGDCRRDIGMMKAQLSFMEHQLRRQKRINDTRNQRNLDRWSRASPVHPHKGTT